MKPTAADIDRLLPQTQCARCGYPGCMPYAEAIARGEADINRCAPGGDATIAALAELTGIETKTLDPDCGDHTPPTVAFIDEDVCIGCTRCIQACPVDAIVGAAKKMHTVIEDECTGCELCILACPVDCIDIVRAPPRQQHEAPPTPYTDIADEVDAIRRRHIPMLTRREADYVRARWQARDTRLAKEHDSREARRRHNRTARARANRKHEIDSMVSAVRARRTSRDQ